MMHYFCYDIYISFNLTDGPMGAKIKDLAMHSGEQDLQPQCLSIQKFTIECAFL